MMRHSYVYSKGSYVVFRFTSKDIGKVFVFRNKYDGKIYSFELLDTMSMPLSEIDEKLLEEFHIRPEVAVEQIWCRIKPDFDRKNLCIGFDETFTDIYTAEADGPIAFGLTLQSEKSYGGNVFTGSALKSNNDDEIEWKLELFAPEAKKAERTHA